MKGNFPKAIDTAGKGKHTKVTKKEKGKTCFLKSLGKH